MANVNYKKQLSFITISFFIALFMLSLPVHAAVKCSLKGTTYIVSGKGKMTAQNIPSKKQKKKIKKVIIQKGVTSIIKYAFNDCSNLEKVSISDTVKEIEPFAFYNTSLKELTIPNSVKKIGGLVTGGEKCPQIINMPGKAEFIWPDDDEMYSARMFEYPDNSGAVTVNLTGLLDIDIIAYLPATNINVMAEDNNYSSYDGLIYTKDMEKLVRIPGGRKEVVVFDGCKTVDLMAFNYKRPTVEYYDSAVSEVNKVVIPESVTTFIGLPENEDDVINNDENIMKNAVWIINSKSIDSISALTLYKLYPNSKGVIKGLAGSGYITLNNNFLLLNSENLPDVNGQFAYKYIGDEKNIVIPNGVTEIGE